MDGSGEPITCADRQPSAAGPISRYSQSERKVQDRLLACDAKQKSGMVCSLRKPPFAAAKRQTVRNRIWALFGLH